MGFFKNIFSSSKKESFDKGLEKTNTSFFSKLNKIIIGKSKIDSDFLDDLEEVLITSDVGVDTTIKIIDRIEARVAKDKYSGIDELNNLLKEEISFLLSENESNTIENFNTTNSDDPYVIMVVGVNGVGKTTTIGKLANMFKKNNLQVILGAADTFRAAAIDQLQIWADRVNIPIIKQSMGSDPASVAFDTLSAAKSNNSDVVIIDTAGRLHNKINLMNELSKIKRVMQKVVPNSPHEILLVLDGTAKGGVVLGIRNEFKIPVKYIGVGETIDDLQLFDKVQFIDSFFKK